MVEATDAVHVRLEESPVRIEVIRVRNFRGLTDCVLTLQPGLTLLVGRNSSGKSRLLRALALASGALSASSDDFTVGGTDEPTIDLILAPASTDSGATFDDRIRTIFGKGVQITSLTTGSERIGWRTVIRRSNEGWGARTEAKLLTYDGGVGEWNLPASAPSLSRDQRKVLAADLVETGRDLAAEMTKQGSPIRRVLDSLEVPEGERKALEKDLQELGGRIVKKSVTLAAIRTRLEDLENHVGGIGKPSVNAIPGRLEELVRMVELALDTGSGGLPLRVHGSGARSLASLEVQGVLYDRRLG